MSIMVPFFLSSAPALGNHQLGPQCVYIPISPGILTCQENIGLRLELGRRAWSCPILRFQNNSHCIYWNLLDFFSRRRRVHPGVAQSLVGSMRSWEIGHTGWNLCSDACKAGTWTSCVPLSLWILPC